MTKDEIIHMAREAGFFINRDGEIESPLEEGYAIDEYLERFAAIVAFNEREKDRLMNYAAIQMAIAGEREACANVCKDLANSQFESGETETAGVLDHCAAAIRARSKHG